MARQLGLTMTVPVERRRRAADYLVKLSALSSVPDQFSIYDIDSHTLFKDFRERIQGRGWSSGESVLIDTLLFLMDIGQTAPNLRHVFYGLDSDNRAVVLESIRILNGYEPTLL